VFNQTDYAEDKFKKSAITPSLLRRRKTLSK